MSTPINSHVLLEFHGELIFLSVVFAETQDMMSNFYLVFNIHIHTCPINLLMH